jgi:hypothetical protein
MALYRLVGGAGHATTQDWAVARGRFLYPARGEEVHTIGSAVPQWLTENVPYEPMVERGLRLLVVVDERGLKAELLKLARERDDANREAAALRRGAECRRLIRVAREAKDWFDHIVEEGRRPGEPRDALEALVDRGPTDNLRLITYGEPGVGRTYLAGAGIAGVPVVASVDAPPDQVWTTFDGQRAVGFEVGADGLLRTIRAD